jgi:hypothetical protein
MSAPMSEQQLAEIKSHRAEAVKVSALADWPLDEYELMKQVLTDSAVLLAEVTRLRAERHATNEALDDAVREVAQLRTAAEKVAGFCAQRAEYVTNLRNCNPNADHDYYRWTGHAEARRQLSHLLGLPVGWPAEDKPVPVRQVEDPHDGPNHHNYALGRDLPIPGPRDGKAL